jgi:CRP-like cAMP-binding protein
VFGWWFVQRFSPQLIKKRHRKCDRYTTPKPGKGGLAALPVASYVAGETILVEGTRTEKLLILRSGAVSIIKGITPIGTVAERGAVFGELSALLDQPHTADVRSLEASQFYVADAALLVRDPVALGYVATILARRLNGANQALLELKGQLDAGVPLSLIDKTIRRIEGLLGAIGDGYIRAGADASMFR